ncbi:14049_t:CDS:2 [Acaulospora colombiana]|uniref:14049_t:CDS:1 n=1 Tax=Acaulospora colombiana TaxID=27376 RepID=A0ACA9K041_9GLOM|nr:14049_t:CDS:2 [Acaulospora colombiana]
MSEGTSSGTQYSLENQQQQSSPPQKTPAAFQPFTTAPQATNCHQIPQGATYAYVPNTVGGPVSQPAPGAKPKRKQVKNACESATSSDANRSPGPEAITPVTASIMLPVIPPSDPNAPPVNPNPIPIPVTLQLPNFQPQTVAMQPNTQNAAIPSNIGQFVMIPATTGTTSYYVLVPPSYLQQQQPLPPPLPSTNKTTPSQGWQSLSQTENVSKTKVEQSKQANTEVLVAPTKTIAKSSDCKCDTTSGGEKENEGANLSVLSQVCSDMLDKSQDDSKQSDDELKDKPPPANSEVATNVKLSPPRVSDGNTPNDGPKVQNDGPALDEEKGKHPSVMTKEIPVNGENEISDGKKYSSCISNTDKEQVNFSGVNSKSPQQMQSSTSTTNDDGLVPINRTEREYQTSPQSPPTFTLRTAVDSPLVFSIPPNTYPVSIKQEGSSFNDVNSTTDYKKRVRHPLGEGQTQLQLESQQINAFAQHQTQPYYHHPEVQAFPRVHEQLPRNSEPFNCQNPLYTRYVNTTTAYSYVFHHNIASESNNGSDASLQGKQNFTNYGDLMKNA